MIPKPQMGELYARSIQTYNRTPQSGELDAWVNVLGHYGYADLDAALRRWQADSELEEFTNRPRGARMPTAAELKLSIERFDRSAKKKFQACGQNGCEEGWIRGFSGMTTGGHLVDPKAGAAKRCPCFFDWAAQQPSPQK